MLLSTELRQRIQADTGCYVTEACDRCGQLLGAVRFTRAGDLGVWCSRVCRGGHVTTAACKGCGTPLAGKRNGAIYCGRICRMRAVRREVQDTPIIVNTPIQNTGLTDAQIGSGYVPTRKPETDVIVHRMEGQSA